MLQSTLKWYTSRPIHNVVLPFRTCRTVLVLMTDWMRKGMLWRWYRVMDWYCGYLQPYSRVPAPLTSPTFPSTPRSAIWNLECGLRMGIKLTWIFMKLVLVILQLYIANYDYMEKHISCAGISTLFFISC